MPIASLDFLGLVAAGALSIPTAVYGIECLVGSLPLQSRSFPKIERSRRPTVAVLVPAHNEESGIEATLASIRRQLLDRDRLVVIADNCSDRTAELARTARAEVIERFDSERRGKGFALDAGIRYLHTAPPDIVFLIDADCSLGADALERLIEVVVATGKPAQSCNLMTAPEGAAFTHAVAEFANVVKNSVRPLGLARLGLPCQATTGLAIPWPLLSQVSVASSNRVEDLKLGLDLAQLGYATRFCEHAHIDSQFPSSKEGTDSQRRRWEGGHLDMIRKEALSLFRPQKPARLVLTLDLMVPPLTLLAILLIAILIFNSILVAAGASVWPLVIAIANILFVIVATAVAWFAQGRKALPVGILHQIPHYVLWKLSLYPRALFGSDGWTRTDRGKPQG
ncbi:glycosyltransferase family 2 protein [Rhizobium sp. RAF56]|uniref:glycosyltransferase family 2 protein n=1 Tax=Rhizobium sp. RAF56 TaxID=3233062 RepID=UPI003F947A82